MKSGNEMHMFLNEKPECNNSHSGLQDEEILDYKLLIHFLKSGAVNWLMMMESFI